MNFNKEVFLKFSNMVCLISFVVFTTGFAVSTAKAALPTGSARLVYLHLPAGSENTQVKITLFKTQQEWETEKGVEFDAGLAQQKEKLISPLPTQAYAFSAYLDVNKNGKFDRNFMGIPEEPWALSGIGDRTPLSTPPWNEIKVEIKAGAPEDVPLYFHQ
jgi:uncharacterized protein (DUF2141 family)